MAAAAGEAGEGVAVACGKAGAPVRVAQPAAARAAHSSAHPAQPKRGRLSNIKKE